MLKTPFLWRAVLFGCLLVGLLYTGVKARQLDLGNSQTRREVFIPLDVENSVGQSFVPHSAPDSSEKQEYQVSLGYEP
jgi:hypothetical protein